MSGHVTLLGAEQVADAARTMRSAADTMTQAASSIAYALEQHQRFMDDWLQRLEHAMEHKL